MKHGARQTNPLVAPYLDIFLLAVPVATGALCDIRPGGEAGRFSLLSRRLRSSSGPAGWGRATEQPRPPAWDWRLSQCDARQCSRIDHRAGGTQQRPHRVVKASITGSIIGNPAGWRFHSRGGNSLPQTNLFNHQGRQARISATSLG